MKVLSGDYLFQTPGGSPSGFFAALTVGFGVLFLVSAFVYWRRAKLAGGNPVLRRFMRRAATVGMWSAGIGLFLALVRYLQLDYVGMPIWMLLLFLYMIGAVGYFVYDYSERYPIAVYRLEESNLQRKYRPQTRARTEPQRPRAKVRGKRRR